MDYFFYIPQAQGSALQCLLRLAAFAKGNWQVTTQDILALNKFIFFWGCYTVIPVLPLPRLTSAMLDWLAIRFHLGVYPVPGSEAGPGFSRSGATAGVM